MNELFRVIGKSDKGIIKGLLCNVSYVTLALMIFLL